MGKLHRSNDMSLANDFYATALAAHAFAAEVPNVREGLFASMLRQPPDRPLSSSWRARRADCLTEKAELCATEQLPIICIGLGIGFFSLPWIKSSPLPMDYPQITERATEFVVIIALMGAGLKIDRIFGWRRWIITWRLIFVTLPLGLVLITLLGGVWLGLPWVIALLLAAVLVPTDPVLASDVQVGPPASGEEYEVRFGLTSEAGINDGAAFPFVHLAITLSLLTASGEPWLWEWLTFNIMWEISIGILGGYLVGRLFGWITFHIPAETKLVKTGDGLIALSATFVSYGLTECLHSYGFLSVFVTALTFRNSSRQLSSISHISVMRVIPESKTP